MGMKMLSAISILICLAFFTFGCFAAEADFYCAYVAKTENGTLFYIDVFCNNKVAAAVFELGFDSGLAEYREISSTDSDGHVSVNLKEDKVIIAFASSSAKNGKLCRVTFNGKGSGDCLFSLHMNQACDGDYNYINGLADQSLSVRLGKDGRVSGSSSSSASSGSELSDRSGSSGSKSTKGKKSEISSDDNADDSKSKGGLYDMRKNDPLKYVLLGAGGVVFVGALVFSGYYLGRKKRLKANVAKDNVSVGDDTPADEKQDQT
jgi:hypothetical protein